MFRAENLADLRSIDSFFSYNDYEFEYACKYLLEKLRRFPRVRVTEKGIQGGDGGVDLKMYGTDGSVIAYGQCKCWRGRFQGLVETIRMFAGCMKRDRVEKGVLIVTVPANAYEKREAERCGVELIDATALEALVRELHAENPDEPPAAPQAHPSSLSARILREVLKAFAVFALAALAVLLWPLVLLGALLMAAAAMPSPPRRRYRSRRRFRRRAF